MRVIDRTPSLERRPKPPKICDADRHMDLGLPHVQRMSSRDFVDSTGVRWRVWSTVPSMKAVLASSPYAAGWLTFESLQSRRRLVPIPSSWETDAPEQLEEWCRVAVEVPRGFQAPLESLRKSTCTCLKAKASEALYLRNDRS